MLIILYSETNANNIATNLGKSEYSYYFVLERYLPALEALGEVVYVQDPASEVDPLYEAELARGGSAVFMSFTPPHRTVLGLKCPMICVLAWEFSSLPNEDWGEDPRNNWVSVIRQVRNVITISQYSTDIIQRELGDAVNVITVPGPVTERDQPDSEKLEQRFAKYLNGIVGRKLQVRAEVIDTADLNIAEDIVLFCDPDGLGGSRKGVHPWEGQELKFIFDATTRKNNGYRFLIGFYDPEEWGAWSRSSTPWISLPVSLEGDFELELDLVGFADNDQREVHVTIGGQTRTLILGNDLKRYQLSFSGVHRTSSIGFSNLIVGYTLGADLLRALSLGIAGMSLHRPQGATNEASVPPAQPEAEQDAITLTFEGPVYTAIFNPEDGRKNWEDIVTAFCWAFREESDKTLILKFTCPSMSSTWGRLFLLFSQLCPFQCRIVVIHGFLSNEEMGALIDVSHFIVNASKAEGQCLPLLEFMREGVPAIAPDHTAMATYINADNSLVVASSRVVTCWPHDPREYERTFFYRIDWASLRDAYVESAQILKSDPERYRQLGFNAAAVVCEHYSEGLIHRRLQNYLSGFTE
jgi:glycosyltransferase involved in cell wall biosynthesis